MNLKVFVVILSGFALACGNSSTEARQVQENSEQVDDTSGPGLAAAQPIVGADRWNLVLQAIGERRVGCVVNHTSRSGDQHLVDRLLASDVEVVKVFAPEHGFRGAASDGEVINDQRDPDTGLPIVSLYGKSKRPTQAMLEGVDLLLFDIQDVGTRFYTYISTMHYVMDAGAEYGLPVLILDRPNPNGHYVDGPVLDTSNYRSFIGMHPIPTVHGLTVGELAHMINGEGWLSGKRRANLDVIEVGDYRVGEEYILPIPPSPNLPNQASIYLYPTLCHYEGTVASIGRGTDFPFQVVGHPKYPDQAFAFQPESRPGAKYAKLKGKKCYGSDLRDAGTMSHDSIAWSSIAAFAKTLNVDPFVDRPKHFNLCVGSNRALKALAAGDLSGFRASYQDELQAYLEQRKPYLLYERK